MQKILGKLGLDYAISKIKDTFLTKAQYDLERKYTAHIVYPYQHVTETRYYLLAKFLPNNQSNGTQLHMNATFGRFGSNAKANMDFIISTRTENYEVDISPEDIKGFYYGSSSAFTKADFILTRAEDMCCYLYLILKNDIDDMYVSPIYMDYEYHYRDLGDLHDKIYKPGIAEYSTAYEGEIILDSICNHLINYEDEINSAKARTSAPVSSSIIWYGSEETIPSEWMREDGRSLNKNDYPLLFERIGYTYGGSRDNFNIPDSRGKVVVHLNETDEEFNDLGKLYGEKTHTLDINEMPAHKHTLRVVRDAINTNSQGVLPKANNDQGNNEGWSPFFQSNNNADDMAIADAGNSQTHNNIQPSITAYRIIKVKEDICTKDLQNLDTVVKQLQTVINNINNSYSYDERKVIGTYKGKPLYQQLVSRNHSSTGDIFIQCPQDIDEMIDYNAYFVDSNGSIRPIGTSLIDYASGTDKGTSITYLSKSSSWFPNNLYFVINGTPGIIEVRAIIRFTSIND